METTINFQTWLLQELEKKNWSQAKLAEKAGVKKSTISRIIRGERGIGSEVSNAIAKALSYPPEYIATMAGILPPKKKSDPTENELLHLYNMLTETEKLEIREWVRFKAEKNRGQNEKIIENTKKRVTQKDEKDNY